MTFDGSVRPVQEGDLAAVGAIYDHYVRTSHATFDVEPMSAERRRAWFEEHPGGRHRALVAPDIVEIGARFVREQHRLGIKRVDQARGDPHLRLREIRFVHGVAECHS